MKVYLDNAATTPLDADILEKMLPYLTTVYGNANSIHSFGREANKAVMDARERVATSINAKASEIYFTSGGTESDNWALKGIARRFKSKGNHIITTKIEHPAVYNTAEQLEKEGFRLTYLNVSEDGIVDLNELESVLCKDTILISVMTANNEVGTIQPIEQIAEIARERKIFFHTDAVQAFGSVKLDVTKTNVSMMSLSAHKIYGPKGIGALYIKSGVLPEKLIIGGHQERTMRGGTTNVPLAVGFGYASEKANANISSFGSIILELRNYFIDEVLKTIPDVRLNGSREKRLSGNCNFTFAGLEGESIQQTLDLMAGIAVSTGSACSSGSLEPSRVMLSMGVPIESAHGSIRFSFGKHNTKEEADYVLDNLKSIVSRLRKMSPIY